MHHRAGFVVHDRVVLILALQRMTLVRAALLPAIEIGRAEVPAPWPLHQVAAQRRHVAHLRRGRMTCRIRQRLRSAAVSPDAPQFRSASSAAQAPDRDPVNPMLCSDRTFRMLTSFGGETIPSFIRSSRSIPPAFTTASPFICERASSTVAQSTKVKRFILSSLLTSCPAPPARWKESSESSASARPSRYKTHCRSPRPA